MKNASGEEYSKKMFLSTKDKVSPGSRVVKKLKYGFNKDCSTKYENPEARPIKTQSNEEIEHSSRFIFPQESHSLSIDRRSYLHSSLMNENSHKLGILHQSLAKQRMNRLQPLKPDRNTIQVNTQNAERRASQPSMENIEKQMDSLLQQKLKLLIQSNKQRLTMRETCRQFKSNTSFKLEQLNNKLRYLLNCIKSNHQQEGLSIYKKWNVLDSKLQLLEKTLAQGKTELQIMKNFYALFANNRTEYKDMSHPVKRNTVKQMGTTRGGVKQQVPLSPLKTKFPFEFASTSQISYKAPGEGDYEKYRYKQPDYQMNPRPVPSSSYKQSYQNYPGMKQHYYSGHKDQLTRLGPFNMTIKPKNSSSPYKIQRTNYKDLDCYNDKFKNLKVSYMSKPQKPNQDSTAEFAQLQKLLNKGRANIERRNKSVQQQLKSTNQDDYQAINEDDQRIFRTQPKDNRLHHFTVGFRSFANQ